MSTTAAPPRLRQTIVRQGGVDLGWHGGRIWRGVSVDVDELWLSWATQVAATLLDAYTRVIRSTKPRQRQPCQIYESQEPE